MHHGKDFGVLAQFTILCDSEHSCVGTIYGEIKMGNGALILFVQQNKCISSKRSQRNTHTKSALFIENSQC